MIPSQLSESTFRTYEPHIARALRQWPNETEFPRESQHTPEGRPLSPHTFVARFRDALVSLQRFHWPTTDSDPELEAKVRAISGSYVVAYDPTGTGSVWFRKRGVRGRPTQLTKENRDSGFTSLADTLGLDFSLGGPVSPEELSAICLLLDRGRLVGPIVIPGSVDPLLSAELEGRLNVAVVFDEVNNKTVVT